MKEIKKERGRINPFRDDRTVQSPVLSGSAGMTGGAFNSLDVPSTNLENDMRENLLDIDNEMDMEWRGTVNRWNKDVKQMERE